MKTKRPAQSMGRSDLGWLKSLFHFSFSNYYNPKNIQFGVLRVINDDLVNPNTGFERHPHRDMEIISYVVDGALTHADSMGNAQTLTRGEVQYMSAGTGVFHSEHNRGADVARFLQIWILPDKGGHKPQYGDFRFPWDARRNQWLHMVSGQTGQAPIRIHQDVNLYALDLDEGRDIELKMGEHRQAYLVQIEGQSRIDTLELDARDALECVGEDLIIHAKTHSHILVVEMEKAEG